MTEPKGDRYVYVVEDFKVSKSDQVPRYIDLVIRSSQMTDDPASQSPGGRRATQRVLGERVQRFQFPDQQAHHLADEILKAARDSQS